MGREYPYLQAGSIEYSLWRRLLPFSLFRGDLGESEYGWSKRLGKGAGCFCQTVEYFDVDNIPLVIASCW
jgi:hypothetical protein